MMQQELNDFLQSIERRAYCIAYSATRNRDEALDIVQESMFKLVEKYSRQTIDEWGPLFTRILQSKIRDWYRRNKVRAGIFSWLGWRNKSDDIEKGDNELEQYPTHNSQIPSQQLETAEMRQGIELAISELPLRQQQVFVLRNIEQFNVAETAHTLGISEGSVKTHNARALQKLQTKLQRFR